MRVKGRKSRDLHFCMLLSMGLMLMSIMVIMLNWTIEDHLDIVDRYQGVCGGYIICSLYVIYVSFMYNHFI